MSYMLACYLFEHLVFIDILVKTSGEKLELIAGCRLPMLPQVTN
jgi:hypothetical protein